ncbi:uncharacterized protein Dmoj_GI27099 [Drosophila mojavensis]|uniref:Uncharacterized protein n=1 Tax=Drosophila mojavensis TaxID=7230 RepID=A0A0Q9X086_DROMO|nr:uncharacterized protein Dmoj_GI27099 [Drosophila mojavensis]
MAHHLQTYFMIATLLLLHFPNSPGSIINSIKNKIFDGVIYGGEKIEAISSVAETAGNYLQNLNGTGIKQTVGSVLGR